MNKILIISIAILLSLCSSCTNDKSEDPNLCFYEASDLRYTGFIKNVIDANCANYSSCHGTSQSQNAGDDLTSYALVKEKINNGEFYNRVFVMKDMPQGSSLSVCDFKKLKDWYDAGSPE